MKRLLLGIGVFGLTLGVGIMGFLQEKSQRKLLFDDQDHLGKLQLFADCLFWTPKFHKHFEVFCFLEI